MQPLCRGFLCFIKQRRSLPPSVVREVAQGSRQPVFRSALSGLSRSLPPPGGKARRKSHNPEERGAGAKANAPRLSGEMFLGEKGQKDREKNHELLYYEREPDCFIGA